MVARDAVVAEGDERKEEEGRGELEDGVEMEWRHWSSLSSFIGGGARRHRRNPLRDPRFTAEIRPPDPRENRVR